MKKLVLLALLLQAFSVWAMSNPDPLMTMVMLDKLEINNDNKLHWKAKAYLGKDMNKLWLKTDGESHKSEREEAEWRLLYGHAIAPYWDVMLGLRHVSQPKPSNDWLELGLQGLAPYFIKTDVSFFANDKGQSSFRLELEKEFMLTQRWGLEPDLEINVNAYQDKDAEVESGLDDIDIGLRLHYQVVREFFPYVGVVWEKSFGFEKEQSSTIVLGFKAWI